MGDRLRPLWSFDDLDASEARFRAALDDEPDDSGRAEVLTQLARVEGLRDRFDDGDALLDEADALAGSAPVVRARIDLERGRLRRSSGDPDAALPLFETAFETAEAIPHEFVAVDAAHMAAIASATHDERLAWTQRGIDRARTSDDPEVVYWLGPLLNNLGWDHYEAGRYEEALEAFQLALAEREQRPDNPEPIALARYAVAKALRALGRADDGIAQAEAAVTWAEGAGRPDGWYHEELAETYAALGRTADAAEQARLAIPLLERDDSTFARDSGRVARLRELAAHG
jgi:tetratricopeptide (TPR) repeat protein